MPILNHWENLTAEPAGLATRRRLIGAGASLVKIDIKAGMKAGRHTHDFEQFVQVLSGSGTLETEEGRQPFGPGSLFHFPADAWHAAEFDTDTVLVETNLMASTS